MLALGGERALGRRARLVVAGHALVLLHQEIHGEVDAVELAARHLQVARRLGAAGQGNGVVALEQRLHRQGRTDLDAGAELHTFSRHLLHAAVDQILLHLEVGDAVAQQPADAIRLLEQRHRVAGTRQLLCTGHAGRTGADDRDALPGLPRRHLRLDPAFLPTTIDDRAFDRFDGHRVVVDVERARRLARGGADAAGELGKVVGRMQHLERIAPAVAAHQLVPLGDDVVDRTAVVTERNAAIHAARALPAHLGRRQRQDELLPVLEPRLDLLVRPFLALDLEEALYQAHYRSTPLICHPERSEGSFLWRIPRKSSG